VELRDLEYFAVVAEHGNLRRAAEALDLSQPALSKTLRRLEQAIGAKLVKRTPKGVELTTVGTAMLQHAQRLQLSRDDITREVADLGQGRVGYLRIGAGPGIAEDLLPATCGAMLQDTTKVSFNITVATNDVLVPALRKGEYDLIVSGIPSTPHEDLVQEPLYADEFAVFASVRHRLAKRKSVPIADLSQEQWALSATNVVSWRALHNAFEVYCLPPPRVALQSNLTSVRLQTVSCSNLLGFDPRRFMKQATRRLPVTEIRVKDLAWSRPVGVSYRRIAYVSPVARRFIEILKANAKEIAKEP